MSRQLLFSVTEKDLEFSAMTAGGPGGQHQNRRHTAVRCVHPASGASATCRELKSQRQNKERAFVLMTQTPTFKAWHRLECSRLLGQTKRAEEAVERLMDPGNLRVDIKVDGRWVPEAEIAR